MTVFALTPVSYVWHYLVARMLYDQVLEPLERGQGSRLATLAVVAVVAFLLGRLRRRAR